ncbi:MAG TPA: peptidoglycan DD-metalloendopeptidase family protein [Alphaproteobacteria bacterium]
MPNKSWRDIRIIVKARFIVLLLVLCAAPAFAQDLATLQGQLVRVGGDIRRIETKLQTLDARLADLKLRDEQLQADYQKQRVKMAEALSAMTRMRRVPKEAVLIRPGGPLQAARTSMLLQASLPAIEHEATEVRELLTELESTQAELREKTEEARAAKQNLDRSHAELSNLIDKRAYGTPLSAADLAAVNKLARDARNLRDLLTALEDDQGDGITVIPQGLLPDSGIADGILPVSGIIRTRYGQMDEIGAKSAGLTIESLPESLVVAPLPGVVRFVGDFKGYGNIVIIAHPGGYHSLLAGLGTIYVKPGQSIVSGEPIAILEPDKNQNQAASKKSVYYELRLHGQPVNPARKLPDLG